MTDTKQYSWLKNIPVEVEAAANCPVLRVSEILALRKGSVVLTLLRAGQSVDVFAGGTRIGAGEFSRGDRCSAVRMVRLGSGN